MLAPPLCNLSVSNILRKRIELKGHYRSFQQCETTEAANMTFTACKGDTRGVPNDFLGVDVEKLCLFLFHRFIREQSGK